MIKKNNRTVKIKYSEIYQNQLVLCVIFFVNIIVENASKKIAENEKRFLSSELEDSTHPYYFESFISSPYIVLDFCIRLEPFSKCGEQSDYYKSIDSVNLKRSWHDLLNSLILNVRNFVLIKYRKMM